MGEIVRWTLCIFIGAPSVLVLAANWLFLIGTVRTRKPTSLVFPFISGLLGTTACLICPVEGVQWFAWLPVVLDVGVLGLVGAIATGQMFRRR